MGSVLSLVGLRSAQSSGLSQSPTEETGQKAPSGQETHTEEELKSSVTDEKPLEEPESNDTSYGVEATAVRTLAASTGTVAILGTTAKVKELNESEVVDFRHSPTEPPINVTKEVTSYVSAQKDNANIVAFSETKEALNPNSADLLKNSLDKQWEGENVLETKECQRPLVTEERYDKSKENGVNEENIVEKKEEGVDDKVENIEVKKKEENNKVGEQKHEVITNEDKLEQSLVSIPHKTEILPKAQKINQESTNFVLGTEKEPVRIIDYQEKKNRAHEPKIVEEMSVKKEENLNKVSHPRDICLKKEEEFEKIVSIDKQNLELMNKEIPTKIATSNEEFDKTTPESEQLSQEVSKTEEDNEISSEQLKTNSLSDMSLSENLNSDGEEAAREAAKALELKEMVESLSATANPVTLDNEISKNIHNPKDVLRDDTTFIPISNVLEEPEPAEAESSTVNDAFEEKIKFGTPQLISEYSSEKEPSTVSIPETSEETISSSYNSQEEKEFSLLKDQDNLDDSPDTLKVKITEHNIQDNENVEKEMEPQIFEENKYILTKNEISEQETNLKYQENEIQQQITESVLELKDIGKESVETEENRFEQKEADHENKEKKVTKNRKLEQNENKEDEKTDSSEKPNEKDQKRNDQLEEEQKKTDKENIGVKYSEMKGTIEVIAATTIIQSGFRGYQVRKHLKETEGESLIKQTFEEEGKQVLEEEKNSLNGAVSIVPEIFDEKGKREEEQENNLSAQSESEKFEKGKEKHLPESLMKIAQNEVDKICKEAEKATESLVTPLLVKDNSDTEIQEEEFPAPPDELLTNDSQNEEIKEDHSSSGTQSTEPTMPLGNNITEGDSSKTEDTTAPSLAESEMPKSAGQSPSLQNDEFRLESSVIENINTEIAMQRDSTEGELTMEEDSTREDDIIASTGSDIVRKTDGENSLTPEDEKAATVIQAGYRGFKTRKRLREELSTRSDTGTVEQEDNELSDMKNEGESNNSISPSDDKSEKELNDSAKKIQAGVRGYLVRKKQKVERDAAVTIQSHFRGFKTRQRLKQNST
ncbi:myb-like protein X [Halyomorpha halys]|uniref:myb-like protein X n=2 Tax=Halyomorpha halys TaxID=286706 RepID=UPI0006D4C6C4|nr:myb-like protein X [Halyomorpha halys]